MSRTSLPRRTTVLLLAATVVASVAAAVAGAPPARAHDHALPGAVLMKDAKELQVGRNVAESSWDAPAGDGMCVNQHASYAPGFPEVDRVAAGSVLRVRISKTQRPDSFTIKAYRAADKEDVPVGDGRQLRRTLEPVFGGGRRIAWDAVFRVNRPARDYYLVTEGHWQDVDGCDNDQYASWSLHVKTGGPS